MPDRHGIAVATICTDEFYPLGQAEAECLGMPGLPIAVVRHPVAKLAPDQVAEIAADAGRHCCVIPSFGNTRSVTVPITAGDGRALWRRHAEPRRKPASSRPRRGSKGAARRKNCTGGLSISHWSNKRNLAPAGADSWKLYRRELSAVGGLTKYY